MVTVLIVDDSPSIRLLLVRRLEMAGYSTMTSASGAEAIAALDEASGGREPDLILLDAILPDADGPEILDRLKAAGPDIPVLVVSAVTGLAKDKAWTAADGHVAKPIDFDDLLGRVETLTSGPPRP